MRTNSPSEDERLRLDDAACFSDACLAEQLERLGSRPAVSLPILTGPILAELAAEAARLAFRPAAYEMGTPKARVYQEFEYCGTVPAAHPVARLGAWFETRIQRALALMPRPPLAKDFTINDIVCQRYRPGDLGITPHRDHIAYTGLITLVILSGRGRYFTCGDRRGSAEQEIPSKPGRAILMPGPGFAGRTDRPFHLVRDIGSPRISVGLRQDARKAGDRAPEQPAQC